MIIPSAWRASGAVGIVTLISFDAGIEGVNAVWNTTSANNTIAPQSGFTGGGNTCGTQGNSAC